MFATSLLFEMPWLLNQFWIVVRNLIPEEERKRVQFCTSKNITDYFALEQLPNCIANGRAVEDYRKVPEGTITIDKWALLVGIVKSPEKALKMKEFFDSVDALHNCSTDDSNNNNKNSVTKST